MKVPLKNESDAAFASYMSDAIVIQTLAQIGGDTELLIHLLRDCFMRGAGHAIERCEREHYKVKP
jgi:hypothetical protein